MKHTANQIYRVRMLVDSQKDLIVQVNQLSDTIFVIDYKSCSIPVHISKMGVLKTFPYDVIYHNEYLPLSY